MFSKKQYDYLRFKNALLSNIIYWEDLPEYIINSSPINTIESIINSDYFPSWLVGFIEVEGAMRCWKLLQCLQLSNSGDILKLLIPNYNRKIIYSGWRLKVLENTMMIIIRWSIVFNHSCKVISLKMIVIEIDNRGSKSKVSSNTFVKEQRADGSWQVKFNQALLSSRCLTCLRCTLMGFERNRARALFLGQLILNTRNN